MNRFSLFGFAIAIIGLAGCNEDKGVCPVESQQLDSVTLVASLSGSGDNGYNDLVLSGVMRFYNEHQNIKMSLLHPEDPEEARIIYNQWQQSTAENPGKAIIVFASDDYRNLLSGSVADPAPNQHVLFFESAESYPQPNITTFRIARYGVSYLAGAMASESKEAHIIAAYEDDGIMRDAIAGFRDGYLQTGGGNLTVDYLSGDQSGYAMPNKAYELAGNFDDSFIYPLAGGSNNGIYKYSRDEFFSLQLIAGMDVNCADYSTRIPFSVLVHIDDVIYSLLNEWLSIGSLPSHIDYYLSDSKAIEIYTTPQFLESVNIFEDYYGVEDYWEKMHEKYKDIAIKKEIEYYER